MKSLVCFALFMLLGSVGFAKSFRVETVVLISGDGITEIDTEEVQAEGWRVVEDKYGETAYYFSATVDESKLPFTKSLSDAVLSISKDGEVSLSISVGDADSSAVGSFSWPKDNKGFMVLPNPIMLKASGGDHASGSWSLDGRVSVSVIP